MLFKSLEQTDKLIVQSICFIIIYLKRSLIRGRHRPKIPVARALYALVHRCAPIYEWSTKIGAHLLTRTV